MGPGGVSYYVSRTRMEISGRVRGVCLLAALCPIRGDDGAYLAAEGSYVDAGGRTVGLRQDDFMIEPTGATWTSSDTSATYPAGWRISVPAHDVQATVRPTIADQEMDTRATTGIVYWEGAVEVNGDRPGVGFVDLTNYDRRPFQAASAQP